MIKERLWSQPGPLNNKMDPEPFFPTQFLIQTLYTTVKTKYPHNSKLLNGIPIPTYCPALVAAWYCSWLMREWRPMIPARSIISWYTVQVSDFKTVDNIRHTYVLYCTNLLRDSNLEKKIIKNTYMQCNVNIMSQHVNINKIKKFNA